MKNLNIRPETEKDCDSIREINCLAFKQKNESVLIDQLRNTPDYVSKLSLVAEREQKIIGHILFYPIRIIGEDNTYNTLALAPMSVHPEHQNQGVGSALVKEGLKRAKDLGFKSVVVVGYPRYYPRFGFKRASAFRIKVPLDIPDEAFLALELAADALKNIEGMVEYPKPYYDTI